MKFNTTECVWQDVQLELTGLEWLAWEDAEMELSSTKTFAIQPAQPAREQLMPVLLTAPISPTVLKPHDQPHYYHSFIHYIHNHSINPCLFQQIRSHGGNSSISIKNDVKNIVRILVKKVGDFCKNWKKGAKVKRNVGVRVHDEMGRYGWFWLGMRKATI